MSRQQACDRRSPSGLGQNLAILTINGLLHQYRGTAVLTALVRSEYTDVVRAHLADLPAKRADFYYLRIKN